MTCGLAVALLMLAGPSVAWACPGCVSSAFGDRTFGWPYLSLIAAPFFIGSGIAGVMAYYYRRTRQTTEMDARGASMAARRDLRPREKETT